jgi:hypothetical protein
VAIATTALVGAGLAGPPVRAQSQDATGAPSAQDPSVQQQIEAMRRELERVQQDNRSMRGEIDSLRALNDDQWLTEQRANEIKALVHDVLADADTRASMQDAGMTAGWNEHFFLGSGDGRFLLVFEGLQQIRFIMNHHDAEDRWRHGFENARTQLTFRGHVFDEDIEYLVRGEFARSGLTSDQFSETPGQQTLLDAWVRYVFTDKWALRFGEFKMPFNREFLVADSELLAVERSLVSEVFSIRRSQGIELQYADAVNRWSAAFSDGATSSITGSRVNTPWSLVDTEWAVSTRYERLLAGTWQQFASMTSPRGDEFGLLAGIGFHAEQGESGIVTGVRDEMRIASVTADISAEWGGANLMAAAYYTYADFPATSFGEVFDLYGVVVQGGVYVAPKWEIFLRGEYGVIETDAPDFQQDLQVVTAGFNYYLDGQDLKWTTDISVAFNEVQQAFASDLAGFRIDGENQDPQIVIRTQFQLLF